MKLKYNKQCTNSTVNLTLTLTNFSTQEKKAIRVLGSPKVVFSEAYDCGTTIMIDTTINEFNSLGTFVFNSDIDNLDDTLDQVSSFLISIHEVLNDVMTELMTVYRQVEKLTSNTNGELTILDGYCHTTLEQDRL